MTQPSPTTVSVYDSLAADLARGSGDLPVLPRAAAEALNLAQSPNMRFDQVVVVVETEPPLVARILSVVNSPLYSRGIPIANLGQALVRMGIQATRDVLYMAVYGSALFEAPRFSRRVGQVFSHGVLVARCARRLAALGGEDEDTAFLAGLLHDVGRARCLKILAMRKKRAENSEVEYAVEALHAEAGVGLVEAWNLPPAVAEACAFHDEPGDEHFTAQRVHLADILVNAVNRFLDAEAVEDAHVKLEKLAIDAEELDMLRAECKADYKRGTR